ncbi:MAG: 3'(2'),5'-bisphosphate nucleotidase CysQ [Rhodobacteraceae bacterium]|nr:3'(2'),5'-bisphosphate nucleotidase CysQ [Paracoccaceae bacterium]
MPGSDLDLLLEAAEEAGKIAMKHFCKDPETWDKGDGQGPVSEADLEIDRMLYAELLAVRPNYGWLSEETEDNADRLRSKSVFIIDPIDGTRAFIAGHENFSHSFAVARDGEITAAVVHLPAKGMTFSAESGGGARLNGSTIQNSDRQAVEGARILASGSQFKAELWKGNPPAVERHFRSSLAYRLCLVAQGRFDGMVTLRPAWEWDVAAGDLIGREAGALTGTKEKALPTYNAETPRLSGLISAAPRVYQGLMARL